MAKTRPTFVAIGTLISLLFLADVSMAFVTTNFNPDDNILMAMGVGFLIGQYIGQLNLISVWAAVSSGSVIVRLPWALLLTVIMWGSLIVGKWYAGESYDTSMILFGLLLGYGCLVTQVPLWIASRIFRWRLVARDEDQTKFSGRFNLQQMFVGTVLLAGTLSICRLMLGDVDWGNLSIWGDLRRLWAFLIPASFCNLVFVVPCIWAVFLVTPTPKKLVAASILLSLVGPIELLVICFFVGNSPSASDFPEWLLLFSMLNVGQVVVVYGSLLMMKKVAGFRLIQVDGNPIGAIK